MIIERSRASARCGLLWAILITLGLWGCEGTHLFAPITVGPQIAFLNATPAPVESGESMMVSVRAVAAVRVDSIVTTVRVGDYEETQVARQLGISSDFSAALDFSIPVSVTDTIGTIEAFAIDAQSNVGPISALTVHTLDNAAPTVTLTLDSPRLGIGAENPVEVSAQDNVGLSQIGFQILSLAGDLIAEFLVDQTGKSVDRVLTYPVPEELALGAVVVVGRAVDHAGNVGVGLPVAAVLSDVDLAEIEILTPLPGAEEPAQSPLFVRVHVSDNDAIATVTIDGVAHRGDATFGTDELVPRFVPTVVTLTASVSDTILQRNLMPAADSTAENAFVRVVAVDREGNVSRDSVEISLLADELAPVAQINSPLEGEERAIGDSVLVETFIQKLPASFRTGITTLRLEGVAFRGDPELGTDLTVPRFLPRTVTFDPPVFDGQVVSRYLLANGDATAEQVFIIATAIDEWGNQGADTVSIQLVPDTIPPAVIIAFPTAGSSFPAGSPVLVQAYGVEPAGDPTQRGVAAMIVDGVSYRPAQVQKYQERRVDFSPAVDQAFLNVFVQPTADVTVETAWIRVTAEDAAGNASTDSVLITLTPPPPSPPPPPELGLVIDPPVGGDGGFPDRGPGVPAGLEFPWSRSGQSGSGARFGRRRASSGVVRRVRSRDGPSKSGPLRLPPGPRRVFSFQRGSSPNGVDLVPNRW